MDICFTASSDDIAHIGKFIWKILKRLGTKLFIITKLLIN